VSALTVGDITVQALVDGSIREVGRDVWRRDGCCGDPWDAHAEMLDGRGRVELAQGSFLVRSGQRLALVDLGIGPVRTERYDGGQLMGALSGAGYAPDDVTDVLFTHLHFDHIGWASMDGRPTFRRASHRVHRADWEHFVEGPGASDATRSTLLPVAPQLEPFDAAGELLPGVRARPVGGHTPGSTVYELSSGSDGALILGDVAHLPFELIERGWRSVFDVDAPRAQEVRIQLAEEAARSGVPVALAHRPQLRLGRLGFARAGLTWEDLPAC